MKTHQFLAYGGWTLTTCEEPVTAEGTACAAAREAVRSFATRVRCVTVKIEMDRQPTEYLLGFTTSDRIPPDGKRHRDGDAHVTVWHQMELRTL